MSFEVSLQTTFFSKQVICQSRENIDLTRSQSGWTILFSLQSHDPYPDTVKQMWKIVVQMDLRMKINMGIIEKEKLYCWWK